VFSRLRFESWHYHTLQVVVVTGHWSRLRFDSWHYQMKILKEHPILSLI